MLNAKHLLAADGGGGGRGWGGVHLHAANSGRHLHGFVKFVI